VEPGTAAATLLHAITSDVLLTSLLTSLLTWRYRGDWEQLGCEQ